MGEEKGVMEDRGKEKWKRVQRERDGQRKGQKESQVGGIGDKGEERGADRGVRTREEARKVYL